MIVLLDYDVVSVTFICTTHKSKQINKHAKKSEETTGKNFQEAMLLGCF